MFRQPCLAFPSNLFWQELGTASDFMHRSQKLFIADEIRVCPQIIPIVRDIQGKAQAFSEGPILHVLPPGDRLISGSVRLVACAEIGHKPGFHFLIAVSRPADLILNTEKPVVSAAQSVLHYIQQLRRKNWICGVFQAAVPVCYGLAAFSLPVPPEKAVR